MLCRLKNITYTGLPRANVEYEIKLINSQPFVILYDLDLEGGRSLTNDAEAVIEDLLYIIPGLNDCIIVYRDSEGCFDRIIYKSNQDLEFLIYAALSFEEFLSMLKEFE